ncbi:MAG TPA: hypothetical protein VLL52_05525, partial [Anaerolineae bacterium]|nr:hypothetical protein [Anaerolineae bacterium]
VRWGIEGDGGGRLVWRLGDEELMREVSVEGGKAFGGGVLTVGEETAPLQVGMVGETAYCGWLAWPRAWCQLGLVEVAGVAVPTGAVNFDDKIALLSASWDEADLVAGGQLEVTLTWQALAAMDKNYTVFVQVLDEGGRLVVGGDAWPVQGTYGTAEWGVGEKVNDTHVVTLPIDLAEGRYRVQVGFYLLATLERLPVLGEEGNVVGDTWVVGDVRYER